MRRQWLGALAGGIGALATTACRGGFACTEEFRPGLMVVVVDSASGAPAASGARLVVRDGAYADSSEIAAGHPELNEVALLGAGERAGTYEVTVRKAGYRDWVQRNVGVDRNECHVETRRLTARLQPE